MGNYCDGSALMKGDEHTLKSIGYLLDNLYECSLASGFDGDDDWLPHIFTEQVSTEGIFYEGHHFSDGVLEVYIRASRTTGDKFFEAMAEQLGLEIVWDYTNDYDDREYTNVYNDGCKEHIGEWKLRTLDRGDLDGGSGGSKPSAAVVKLMSLDGAYSVNSNTGAGGSASLGDASQSKPYTPETISWRDIEVQLRIGAAIGRALQYDYEIDRDVTQAFNIAAATHTYVAAKLCYIKSTGNSGCKLNDQDQQEFNTALSRFDAVFTGGVESITLMESIQNSGVDLTLQSWAIRLFELTKRLYVLLYSNRRYAVADTHLN